MKTMLIDKHTFDAYSASEICELWAQLTEAAKIDEEVRTFLVTFTPWAKERLGTMS